ncbi:MAG: hypothetical protein R3C56_41435 [Pirellulaceae bacterium]
MKLVAPHDETSEMLIQKFQLAAVGAVAGVGGMVLWSGLHSTLLILIGCAVLALSGFIAGAIDREKMRQKGSLWILADVQMASAMLCSFCLILAIPGFATGNNVVASILSIVAVITADLLRNAYHL